MTIHTVINIVQPIASCALLFWSVVMLPAMDCARKTLCSYAGHENLPCGVYAALALAMVIKAKIAVREGQLDRAHDHTLHGLASALLAFAHLLV